MTHNYGLLINGRYKHLLEIGDIVKNIDNENDKVKITDICDNLIIEGKWKDVHEFLEEAVVIPRFPSSIGFISFLDESKKFCFFPITYNGEDNGIKKYQTEFGSFDFVEVDVMLREIYVKRHELNYTFNLAEDDSKRKGMLHMKLKNYVLQYYKKDVEQFGKTETIFLYVSIILMFAFGVAAAILVNFQLKIACILVILGLLLGLINIVYFSIISSQKKRKY